MVAPFPVPAAKDTTLDTLDSDDIVILIPVYNDWAALGAILPKLSDALATERAKDTFRVLLVDDGSTEPLRPEFAQACRSLERVDVLHMRRNLGHQRAIAIGLSYTEAQIPCRAVVVMDGDGEDIPADVPRLLERYEASGEEKAVFAQRTRRTERLSFRLFYLLYRGAHYMLTGERVRVGNFSVISRAHLSQMVCVSDLWNHYAAAVLKVRLPLETIPLARGYRADGTSRMNFVSLVVHGLSAMSVYGDRIGVRMLSALTVVLTLNLMVLIGMLVAHFGFGVFLPNWTKTAALILLLVIPQMLLVSLIFVFIVLEGRGGSSFLPCREYPYFVLRLEALTGMEGASRKVSAPQ